MFYTDMISIKETIFLNYLPNFDQFYLKPSQFKITVYFLLTVYSVTYFIGNTRISVSTNIFLRFFILSYPIEIIFL